MTIEEKREAVSILADKNLTARSIAAHFTNVTRSAIVGHCYRHKIKLPGSPAASATGQGRKRKTQPPRPIGNRASKPLPAPVAVPSPEAARSFIDVITNGGCKWPLWDAFEGPDVSKCCGAPRDPDAPYCDFHTQRAA